MKVLQERCAPASMLERLMEVVRPEFRAEVFLPPCDSPVFFQGTCRVPSCPTAISFASKGLCTRHHHRWKKHPEEDFERWLIEEDVETIAYLTVLACALEGCNRAHHGHSLCGRHLSIWDSAGRPDVEGWLSKVRYEPPRQGGGEKPCAAPGV